MLQMIKKIAIYEDLYSIPENMIGQIINGELIAMPRPSPKHCNVVSGIGFEIGPPYRFGRGGPGGWVILDEPEIKLGQDIFVPDLAGWKKERLTKFPNTNYISVPPDWVCEVLSPSTEKTDRAKKMPIYALFGVPYLWLINPVEEIFEVYKLDSGRWMLFSVYAENDKVRAEPFQEIEIDLQNLWFEAEE